MTRTVDRVGGQLMVDKDLDRVGGQLMVDKDCRQGGWAVNG